jgi:hypothetical protein
MRKFLLYLRIAFSATCLIACVLLIMLRVRSRHWEDEAYFSVVRQKVSLHSCYGAIGAEIYIGGADLIPSGIGSHWFKDLNASGIVSPWRFSCSVASLPSIGAAVQPLVCYVGVPHWFAVFVAATLAAVPWLRWSNRFTLRTLLIATTLVAVVLGLIAWLR